MSAPTSPGVQGDLKGTTDTLRVSKPVQEDESKRKSVVDHEEPQNAPTMSVAASSGASTSGPHGNNPAAGKVDITSPQHGGVPKAGSKEGQTGKVSAAAAKAKTKEEKKARRVQKRAETSQNEETPAAITTKAKTPQDSVDTEVLPTPKKSTPPPPKPWPRASQRKMSQPEGTDEQFDWFSHLRPDPERGTRRFHVHTAIEALGHQLKDFLICGSTARCVAMLNALKEVIADYKTPVGKSLSRHLTRHLNTQIEHLNNCRQLSISQRNAIGWLKVDEVSKVDPSTPDSEATAKLCEAIDNFIAERFTAASDQISYDAALKIDDNDVILTFAKSAVVQMALLEAKNMGKNFRVVIVDSRPLCEGRQLGIGLADAGIEVEYTLVHGISQAMQGVTKVFLGAHGMLGNGKLYSRVGTAMVAATAHHDNIPVIVCCQTIKFTDRVAIDSIASNELGPVEQLTDGMEGLTNWQDVPGLQILNLMYDVSPSKYINLIITEIGSLPATSVPAVVAILNLPA
ncbi:MAG: hypothetical protein M1814_004894 [Vezdaea aestivalis]|nr:MAG: hypothetical protein M1814_004894 [Vezdaea aestivalis]